MTMVGSVCAPPRSVENQDTVSRVNYGVVFQKQRDLYLAQEYWLHTFQINLPDITFDIPNCYHSHQTCHLINTVIMQINHLKHSTLSSIQNIMKIIYESIPQTKMGKTRSSRAFLPFVGQLSRSFFGIATTHDVDILASYINQLEEVNIRIFF